MLVSSAAMLWESLWAPYDQPTYDWVLARLEAADVILDIGAGDLRLARQMAHIVRHVYAIEIDPTLNIHNRIDLPANLTLIEGDALKLEFPPDITCGILLMRHCTHFREYAAKLGKAGARRLFTNARWGMGVECVDLIAPRQAYDQLPFGWYACWCGKTGFKPGPVDDMTDATLEYDHQVSDCPACSQKYHKQ